jgi:hypothetical protein
MAPRHYPGLTGDAVRARAAALTRFERAAESLPSMLSPAEAVAAVGLLYDLLPAASRERPVDPSGVAELHRALSVLRGR